MKNIVFDLYGTLVDIHTDETRSALWKPIAALYACYGARYGWRELRDAYRRMVAEETKRQAARVGSEWPEIDLGRVFLRLRNEAPGAAPWTGDEDTWVQAVANAFRVLSRAWLRPYPHTHAALAALRQRGHRLYLLSNAQALFTRPELSVMGLADAFDGVFISSERGVKKPEPRFMADLLAAWRLDPAETVMVGNEVASDMAVADACGVAGVLLNTGGLSRDEIDAQIARAGIRHRERLRIIGSGDIAELLEMAL